MTAEELLDRLAGFDGNPAQFLEHLLAVQCFLSHANYGAVLRSSEATSLDVLALWPAPAEQAGSASWLTRSAQSIRQSLSARKVVFQRLDESDGPDNQKEDEHVFSVPLELVNIGPVAAAFLLRAGNGRVIQRMRNQLELSLRLLGAGEARLAGNRHLEGLQRLKQAIETLSAVNSQERFSGAAVTICNELASRWRCERVSLGMLKGRYVQVRAMSHTEDFSRKMKIVDNIEAAMEECIDQDIEIVSPADEQATYVVRAAEELSKRHGPVAVLSLPLRHNGNAVGVVTLERDRNSPFSQSEIETLRLCCEMFTARLAALYEQDRWFGARAAQKLRSLFAGLLAPKHTWAKVAAILVFAAVLFLVFAKGEFRVKSPFVLEAAQQQVVPAPFDGYIRDVENEVGDSVEANKSVLARLDTAELRLNLAAAKAERAGYLKQADAAMRDGETAQVQIARANADKISAEIDLLTYMIGQADLVAPIDGTIVKGDLKSQIGAPVKTGDILFEVTQLDTLRAKLFVPEEEIFHIQPGQEGKLATASYPDKEIKFLVERINPMAEVVNRRNVFPVRVRLLSTYPWMRPGMEGVSKVSAGQRRYVWIWTRKIVNWVRMKLWL